MHPRDCRIGLIQPKNRDLDPLTADRDLSIVQQAEAEPLVWWEPPAMPRTFSGTGGVLVAGQNGELTVREAGRLGGRKVAEKYGREFYSEIGKKGGRTVLARRGQNFFETIGKKGGTSVRDSHGPDFYAIIGKKGGDLVKARHGSDYYARIGKIGGSRRGQRKAEAALAAE